MHIIIKGDENPSPNIPVVVPVPLVVGVVVAGVVVVGVFVVE
jgi:hypothetical protein